MDNLFRAIEVAVLVVGAVGGVYLWRTRKRQVSADAAKNEASAVDIIADAAKGLVEPLKAQLNDMQAEIEELRATNSRLEGEVAKLREKLDGYVRDEAAYQAEGFRMVHAHLRAAEGSGYAIDFLVRRGFTVRRIGRGGGRA